MKINKFVVCCMLLLFLAGCAQTVSRPESVASGALIGAGVGALAGGGIAAGVGASKGGGLGAAILLPIGIVGGAAVGALVGGLIGYFTSEASKPPPARSDSKISSER
jgi:hypothetical protein